MTKEARPVPSWATHLQDCRGSLKWDHNQTVVEVGMGKSLSMAIVDTGSCKTIASQSMCDALGLTVTKAVGGNCGTYAVPGTGSVNQYVGVVT